MTAEGTIFDVSVWAELEPDTSPTTSRHAKIKVNQVYQKQPGGNLKWRKSHLSAMPLKKNNMLDLEVNDNDKTDIKRGFFFKIRRP